MEIASIIIIAITLLLMLTSIIFNWEIKLKSFQFSLYWVIASIGAFLCLSANSYGGGGSSSALRNIIFSSGNMNPIKILIIFLSCASISVLLDKIGFFSYLASIVLKKSKSSQTKLFFSFSAIIALLTIFTSNDILILTFTPFICYFTKNAKTDPRPYIISEFVCANIWSMFFFIDNPTNIYMCSIFEITFFQYALKMVLPTLCAGILSTSIVYLLFRKTLKKPISVDEVEIIKPDKTLLSIGLTALISMVVLMAISNYIGLELWYIPLICSLLAYLSFFFVLLIKKQSFTPIIKAIKSLPYSLIPFFLSMSIFIAVTSNSGFMSKFANYLSAQNIFVVGIIAFLLGNLLNNIPMTMIMTSLLTMAITPLNSVYGVIAASNICALLTPIGSLAGMMFMGILKDNKIKFNFRQFVSYGTIVSIPTILLTLLIILVV